MRETKWAGIEAEKFILTFHEVDGKKDLWQ